jgi:hypothetical protein
MPTSTNLSTLAGLVTRVRRRSDHENSTFVSDAEVQQYVQESYFELYDLLVESLGPQHFYANLSFSTAAGTAAYALTDQLGDPGPFETFALPLDVYKILGVDVNVDGTLRPIRATTPYERARSGEDTGGWPHAARVRYFFGTEVNTINQYRFIAFTPTPRGVHTVRIHYVPMPQPLEGDTETGGSRTFLHFAHWDEYIVLDAAAKVLEKEESDSSYLLRRLEAMRQRIRDHANTMNTEDGGAIRDTTRDFQSAGRLLRGEPWD